MKTSKAHPIMTAPSEVTAVTPGQRLRAVAAHRAEEILAEVAPTLKRLRTLFLVLTISIPLFMVGLVAVLWHFAH